MDGRELPTTQPGQNIGFSHCLFSFGMATKIQSMVHWRSSLLLHWPCHRRRLGVPQDPQDRLCTRRWVCCCHGDGCRHSQWAENTPGQSEPRRKERAGQELISPMRKERDFDELWTSTFWSRCHRTITKQNKINIYFSLLTFYLIFLRANIQNVNFLKNRFKNKFLNILMEFS